MAIRRLAFDLATVRTNVEVRLGGATAIRFHAVPAAVSVKLDGVSGDALDVASPFGISRCDPPFEAMHLTNAAAAGTLVVLLADAGESFDNFLAASSASAVESLVAKLQAVPSNVYANSAPAQIAGLTITIINNSGGVLTSALQRGAGLNFYSRRLSCPASGTVSARIHEGIDQLIVPLSGLFDPLGAARTMQTGSWRRRDTVHVARNITGANTGKAFWGYFSSAALDLYGVGFVLSEVSANWYAHIGRYTLAPIYNVDCGVPGVGVLTVLELRIGVRAGTVTPYIEWWINGTKRTQWEGRFANDLNSVQYPLPSHGCWRSAGNSLDYIMLDIMCMDGDAHFYTPGSL